MHLETVVAAQMEVTFEKYVARQLQQSGASSASICRQSGIRPETLSRIRNSRRLPTEAQARLILQALGVDEAVARLFWATGQNVPVQPELVALLNPAREEIGGILRLILEHADVADPKWVKAAFSTTRVRFEETVQRYRIRRSQEINDAIC